MPRKRAGRRDPAGGKTKRRYAVWAWLTSDKVRRTAEVVRVVVQVLAVLQGDDAPS